MEPLSYKGIPSRCAVVVVTDGGAATHKFRRSTAKWYPGDDFERSGFGPGDQTDLSHLKSPLEGLLDKVKTGNAGVANNRFIAPPPPKHNIS